MNADFFPIHVGAIQWKARQSTECIRSASNVEMSDIPPALEKFIAEEIGSIEQLEILLTVAASPDRYWSAKEVYDVVKSSVQSADRRLKEFANRGLLRQHPDSHGQFQFCPSRAKCRELVEELDEFYRNRPVKIIQFIYSRVPQGVTEFARAFQIRENK